MFSILFFFKCAVCDIMWENMLDPDRPQMAMWRMRVNAGYLRLQSHAQNMKYLNKDRLT